MSVVVRMKMPKCCDDCDANYDCCACGISGEFWFRNPKYKEFDSSKERLPNCPIICQLPEGHGRLGDLDALAAGCDDPYWCRWLSEIEDAPTIVPAEAERKVDASDAVTPTDTPTDTPTVTAERSET